MYKKKYVALVCIVFCSAYFFHYSWKSRTQWIPVSWTLAPKGTWKRKRRRASAFPPSPWAGKSPATAILKSNTNKNNPEKTETRSPNKFDDSKRVRAQNRHERRGRSSPIIISSSWRFHRSMSCLVCFLFCENCPASAAFKSTSICSTGLCVCHQMFLFSSRVIEYKSVQFFSFHVFTHSQAHTAEKWRSVEQIFQIEVRTFLFFLWSCATFFSLFLTSPKVSPNLSHIQNSVGWKKFTTRVFRLLNSFFSYWNGQVKNDSDSKVFHSTADFRTRLGKGALLLCKNHQCM